MFQPELSLIPQPDGTFTLLVKALVPTTCYTAGAITPRGQVQIPEAVSYNFDIVHHHGFCGQVVHYVHATLPGLRPEPGHDFLIVFSRVDGKDAGHAAVTFPKVEALKSVATKPLPGCSIVPDSVSAVAFSGLIGPAELKVSCLVVTPTPGYTAKLVPAKPAGFNPRILLLNLEIMPPSGPQIELLTTIAVHYEEKPYRGDYTDVTILNGSQSVTVPVIVILSAFEASHAYGFSTHSVRR